MPEFPRRVDFIIVGMCPMRMRLHPVNTSSKLNYFQFVALKCGLSSGLSVKSYLVLRFLTLVIVQMKHHNCSDQTEAP